MERSTLSTAVSSGHFSPKKAAALLAAVISTVVFCAADAVARSYPFGPRTRNVNDLGNQYVPFHAHLWDLLHGRADGGLFVNWQSGFGSGLHFPTSPGGSDSRRRVAPPGPSSSAWAWPHRW